MVTSWKWSIAVMILNHRRIMSSLRTIIKPAPRNPALATLFSDRYPPSFLESANKTTAVPLQLNDEILWSFGGKILGCLLGTIFRFRVSPKLRMKIGSHRKSLNKLISVLFRCFFRNKYQHIAFIIVAQTQRLSTILSVLMKCGHERTLGTLFKTLRLLDAYMQQWIGSPLLQVR